MKNNSAPNYIGDTSPSAALSHYIITGDPGDGAGTGFTNESEVLQLLGSPEMG